MKYTFFFFTKLQARYFLSNDIWFIFENHNCLQGSSIHLVKKINLSTDMSGLTVVMANDINKTVGDVIIKIPIIN